MFSPLVNKTPVRHESNASETQARFFLYSVIFLCFGFEPEAADGLFNTALTEAFGNCSLYCLSTHGDVALASVFNALQREG